MHKPNVLYCIARQCLAQEFPDVSEALTEPNGLLAAGGDLTVELLLSAYSKGIFPWYEAGQPILWWSPDPRSVLFPHRLRVSHSLRKTLRRGNFEISFDRCFDRVIRACAGTRRSSSGTWITESMINAYCDLSNRGIAHSVECWQESQLVGGLYGLALGQVFFGESMFSKATDASKIAFVYLIEHLKEHGFQLIDCQVHSQHLESLGAEQIPRASFLKLMGSWCPGSSTISVWRHPS